MPAMFTQCPHCPYRFHFDYDFRPSHCPKCRGPLDTKNLKVIESLRGDSSREPSDRGAVPILPGEPGFEDYQRGAEADARRGKALADSLKTEE